MLSPRIMATNKAGKFFCFIIALISPVHQFQGQEAEDRGPGPAPPQPETPGSSTSLRLCVFLATGRPCCPLCPPHWMAVGTWRANGCERSLEILKVMLKVFWVLFLLLQILVELNCSYLCLTSSISLSLHAHVPGLPPTPAKGIPVQAHLPSASLLGAQPSA